MITNLDLKLLVEFEGLIIIVEYGKWIQQKDRNAHFNIKPQMGLRPETSDNENYQNARNFIINKFKESTLYADLLNKCRKTIELFEN